MTKFQNYLHYKLPITMNPLEYGNLIEQFDNKYIIQLNTSNIVIIKELDNENYVKFFRKGELIFEFKDTYISENTFIRTILDNKFTFKDNKLFSTEILSTASYFTIYKDTSYTPLSLNKKLFNNTLLNINSNKLNDHKKRLFHSSSQLYSSFDLTTFTKNNVTFLSDQNINKKLVTIEKYNYFKIPKLDVNVLNDFLQQLELNKAYIILPILAVEGLESNTPILSLTNKI